MAWKRGESGNPAGRPPGVGDVARLRAQLYDAAPEIVAKMIENARTGEPVALRLFAERVLPALRAEAAAIRVQLPTGTLTEQAKALLVAAASGELATDQASELIAAIGRIVSVEQGDEIRRRLDELEHGDLA